jgi:hypothetical protein
MVTLSKRVGNYRIDKPKEMQEGCKEKEYFGHEFKQSGRKKP